MRQTFWQRLNKPFIALAPMEDVTDFAFREIVARKLGKPDVIYTEFTNADGLVSEEGHTKVVRRLKYSENQRPIVAQLWGIHPENMEKATRMVAKMGFDGIDLNMGCPDRAVVKIGAGSGLIKNPQLARELIEAVRRGAPNLGLSVKTRLGFNKIQTEEWISFLLRQKLDALAVHARTKKEMSKVPAHWDEIGKIAKIRNEIAPQTLIIGNGDVKSLAEGYHFANKYKIEGIMIGRGIFENPWIFNRKQQAHSIREKLELLLAHTKLFVETNSQGRNFALMKKFFKIYIRDFDGASEMRQKLMACNDYSDVQTAVEVLLQEL